MSSVNKKSVIRVPRNWVPVFVFLALIAVCAPSAYSDDKQILEQLYQEIIGSSNGVGDVDKPVKLTNGLGKPTESENMQMDNLHPDIDPAAEKLRQDIQKIVDEANIRHEDAVKFMQDTK